MRLPFASEQRLKNGFYETNSRSYAVSRPVSHNLRDAKLGFLAWGRALHNAARKAMRLTMKCSLLAFTATVIWPLRAVQRGVAGTARAFVAARSQAAAWGRRALKPAMILCARFGRFLKTFPGDSETHTNIDDVFRFAREQQLTPSKKKSRVNAQIAADVREAFRFGMPPAVPPSVHGRRRRLRALSGLHKGGIATTAATIGLVTVLANPARSEALPNLEGVRYDSGLATIDPTTGALDLYASTSFTGTPQTAAVTKVLPENFTSIDLSFSLNAVDAPESRSGDQADMPSAFRGQIELVAVDPTGAPVGPPWLSLDTGAVDMLGGTLQGSLVSDDPNEPWSPSVRGPQENNDLSSRSVPLRPGMNALTVRHVDDLFVATVNGQPILISKGKQRPPLQPGERLQVRVSVGPLGQSQRNSSRPAKNELFAPSTNSTGPAISVYTIGFSTAPTSRSNTGLATALPASLAGATR